MNSLGVHITSSRQLNVLFDHQIRRSEGIRTSYNKVVTDKYFLRYQSLNMLKFDVLKGMGEKSPSPKWDSDVILS